MAILCCPVHGVDATILPQWNVLYYLIVFFVIEVIGAVLQERRKRKYVV